jgi:hypothetical protein
MQTKPKGRDFFDYTKGAQVTSIKDLKTGHIFLQHSKQFNAENTIMVISQDTTPLNREIVYATYYNPETGEKGPEQFAIWGWELKDRDMWVALYNGEPAR